MRLSLKPAETTQAPPSLNSMPRYFGPSRYSQLPRGVRADGVAQPKAQSSSATGATRASVTASLRLDAGFLHHLHPARVLGADEAAEFAGGHGADFGALVDEALADRGVVHDVGH